MSDAPGSAVIPRHAAPARGGVLVVVVLLLALAGLCGYELYATLAQTRSPILASAAKRGLAPVLDRPYLQWAGVGAAVVGLGFLVLAVRRRPPSHRGYGEDPHLWLSGTSVARLCSAIARRVPGVNSAITRVGRKRIEVSVRAGGREPADIDAEIRRELAPLMTSLGGSKLTVRVHAEGSR